MRRRLLLRLFLVLLLLYIILWTQLPLKAEIRPVIWPDIRSEIRPQVKSCPSYHLNVDPFDDYVLPNLKTREKLVCPQEEVLTFVDQQKSLLMVRPEVAQIVICLFSWIHMEFSQILVYSQRMVIPLNGVRFSRDNFVANVSCYNRSQGMPIYENTHLWVPDFPKTNATGPSVFILVLESLSRFSFIRFMPKTRAALDSLGHVQVMRGLNKVAPNSFPNSMALLAGNTGEDMDKPDSYDHWLPYVWEQFKAKGYVTGFTEDVPELGLFTYDAPGFKVQPTDFSPIPFWLQLFEKHGLVQFVDNETLYCFHKSGSVVETFLDQTMQFVLKMQRQDQPYFLFSFLIQMTHEDFNDFQLVDDPVAQFVDWFKENPELLNNTVFIVMGDHGPRYGGIVNSPLGQLETRLPFFAIRVPETLVQKHPHLPQFLTSNSDKLLSWFDIHQLLVDVASDNYTQINIKRNNVTLLSPWRELVPLNRTCGDANISEIYCVCDKFLEVSAMDSVFAISHYEESAKSLAQILASIVDPLFGVHLTHKITLKVTYILPEGNETFSSQEMVKLIVLTQPLYFTVEAVMVRESSPSLSEQPEEFGSWRLFDPKGKLDSFAKHLRQQRSLYSSRTFEAFR